MRTHSTSPEIADALEELQKVPLNPEMQELLRKGLSALRSKIEANETIYPKDCAFMEEITKWLKDSQEGLKYGFSVEKWRKVKPFIKETGFNKQWLKETFCFENEKIICEGDLDLEGCSGLTHLPESLSVGRDLYLAGFKQSVIEQAEKMKAEGKIDGEIMI